MSRKRWEQEKVAGADVVKGFLPFFCPANPFLPRGEFVVGDLARTWANRLAGQFPGDKHGQAARGDGVAVGNVAFDLEQVVLRIGDLLPAFQIAQLPRQLPRLWGRPASKSPIAPLAGARPAPDTDGQLRSLVPACLIRLMPR